MKLNKTIKKENILKTVFLFAIAIFVLSYWIAYVYLLSILKEIIILAFIVFCHIYLYFVLVDRFKNIDKFIVLLGTHMVIFPIIQVFLYSIDKRQYTYNPEFINQKKYEIEQELSKYENIYLLEKLKEELQIPSKIVSGNHYVKGRDSLPFAVKVEPKYFNKTPSARGSGTPHRAPSYYTVTVVHKNDSITYNRGRIETDLQSFNRIIEYKKKLSQDLANPSSRIEHFDIWLDSASGFLLGNVKPNSRLTQALQLIQIFLISIVLLIFGDFVVNLKSLKIREKKAKKGKDKYLI